jgi:hypothetical protein
VDREIIPGENHPHRARGVNTRDDDRDAPDPQQPNPLESDPNVARHSCLRLHLMDPTT